MKIKKKITYLQIVFFAFFIQTIPSNSLESIKCTFINDQFHDTPEKKLEYLYDISKTTKGGNINFAHIALSAHSIFTLQTNPGYRLIASGIIFFAIFAPFFLKTNFIYPPIKKLFGSYGNIPKVFKKIFLRPLFQSLFKESIQYTCIKILSWVNSFDKNQQDEFDERDQENRKKIDRLYTEIVYRSFIKYATNITEATRSIYFIIKFLGGIRAFYKMEKMKKGAFFFRKIFPYLSVPKWLKDFKPIKQILSSMPYQGNTFFKNFFNKVLIKQMVKSLAGKDTTTPKFYLPRIDGKFLIREIIGFCKSFSFLAREIRENNKIYTQLQTINDQLKEGKSNKNFTNIFNTMQLTDLSKIFAIEDDRIDLIPLEATPCSEGNDKKTLLFNNKEELKKYKKTLPVNNNGQNQDTHYLEKNIFTVMPAFYTCDEAFKQSFIDTIKINFIKNSAFLYAVRSGHTQNLSLLLKSILFSSAFNIVATTYDNRFSPFLCFVDDIITEGQVHKIIFNNHRERDFVKKLIENKENTNYIIFSSGKINLPNQQK